MQSKDPEISQGSSKRGTNSTSCLRDTEELSRNFQPKETSLNYFYRRKQGLPRISSHDGGCSSAVQLSILGWRVLR